MLHARRHGSRALAVPQLGHRFRPQPRARSQGRALHALHSARVEPEQHQELQRIRREKELLGAGPS